MITWLKEKYLFTALVGLLLVSVAGLFLFSAEVYQWSPPCFFKKELDLYCTFCGGFRAISHLLKGNVYKAWFYNPLVVMAAPYVGYQITRNSIGLWKGRRLIFQVSIYKFYLLLALITGFTILRNTSIYPYQF